MRLIDRALHLASAAHLAAPAEKLRAALVALAEAELLTDPTERDAWRIRAEVAETEVRRLACENDRLRSGQPLPPCPARSRTGQPCSQRTHRTRTHTYVSPAGDAVLHWVGGE